MPSTYRPLDKTDPGGAAIKVDDPSLTVTVEGGVGLRPIMDWLAAYK